MTDIRLLTETGCLENRTQPVEQETPHIPDHPLRAIIIGAHPDDPDIGARLSLISFVLVVVLQWVNSGMQEQRIPANGAQE